LRRCLKLEMSCNHCGFDASFRCCHVLYCGDQCQKADFAKHLNVCPRVLIEGKRPYSVKLKSGRPKKKRRIIDWEELRQMEVFSVLTQYLNRDDIRNLSTVSRDVRKRIRHKYFDRVILYLSRNFDRDMQGTIGPFIKSIQVDDIETLLKWGNFDTVTYISITTTPSLAGIENFRNLKILNIGDFNGSLVNFRFPEGLRVLTMLGYNQPLDGVVFPESLEHLEFNSFSYPVGNYRFPPNLKYLEFSGVYSRSLRNAILPPLLETIIIRNPKLVPDGFVHAGFMTFIRESP
jgi:hypothetical protein